MASKMPRWLVGCGIGCAALLALAIGGAGVGAVYVGKLFDEVDSAVAVRTELEERFDAPQTFTPAADGAIGADRMERFLRVQRTLQPFCVRFDETVGRIDRIDARGSEAPPLPRRGPRRDRRCAGFRAAHHRVHRRP